MRQNHIQENTAFDTMMRELGRPSTAARLQAWVFAAAFDRQVIAGDIPAPGSALAAHVIRLSTVRERENVARALRNVLRGGPNNKLVAQVRIPVSADRIDGCRDIIDDITLHLHSQRPVSVEGMARLRLLLSDGTGPLYFQGNSDLEAELRDALAML